MTEWLGIAAIALAALPAALAALNLTVLRAPRSGAPRPETLVSILIPARNEAARIGAAIKAALASEGVAIEVIVMDDGSTDRTAEIVTDCAARDPRVRILTVPALREGWTGKTHACHHLAEAAKGTELLFIDADVCLSGHAAADLAVHAQTTGAALVSAVPRQIMGSLGELLTVPMINLLLLGYLPIPLMRRSADPSLGAACGQLILVDAKAYRDTGGHGAIRHVMHDGIQLARLFRRRSHRTELVAGNRLASCRMYGGLAEAWTGFSKNAHEGMAKPVALPVWTVLLAGGHILPPALTALAPSSAALAACALSFGTRAAVTAATRENPLSIPLHPLTVLVGLALQWTALVRHWAGRPIGWKGRLYPTG